MLFFRTQTLKRTTLWGRQTVLVLLQKYKTIRSSGAQQTKARRQDQSQCFVLSVIKKKCFVLSPTEFKKNSSRQVEDRLLCEWSKKRELMDFTTSIKRTHDHNRSHVYITVVRTRNKQSTHDHALARNSSPDWMSLLTTNQNPKAPASPSSVNTHSLPYPCCQDPEITVTIALGRKGTRTKIRRYLDCTTNFFQP